MQRKRLRVDGGGRVADRCRRAGETVANARLLSITLERFKSYDKATTVPLSPLTVILGKNNSGKSSIIQALLLLKQTISSPRPDVPLHLQGALFDATSLREITFGWPRAGASVPGPRIGIRWSSSVDMNAAWETAGKPDNNLIAKKMELDWFSDDVWQSPREVVVEIVLDYADVKERTVLTEVVVSAFDSRDATEPKLRYILKRNQKGRYVCYVWDVQTEATEINVEFDHFLPFLDLDRQNLGPRHHQRPWHNAFKILLAEPLDDLKSILTKLGYLGAMRTPPMALYRPDPVPPEEIGASAEFAAPILHAHRSDCVHYLPPLCVEGDTITLPDTVHARTLEQAINEVLVALGIDTPMKIDVRDLGFRLLFGQASLQHVGRGLSYLLPVVELGLLSDPLRFDDSLADTPLQAYVDACSRTAHIAMEEGDAHLHPKVQTRLAHWLVALAMARRQIIVETHSDHLVRRLRGLAARAKPGSAFERWLLENVSIVKVEQNNGLSTAEAVKLTPQGSLEDWPADFMDEATDEERAIYDASLDKPIEPPAPIADLGVVLHDDGEEPDVGP